MQVNSVSATPPNTAGNASSTAPKPAKTAAAPKAASAAPPPVAQTTSAAPAPANTSAKSAPAAAPVQPTAPQAASDAAASLVSQIYSTSVGGKSYSGSVVQSDGQYEVSIPNLPGATASASTAQAAENALTLKIDILV
ncbi:MAG: hypothetical protein WBF89_00315 [Steroidobacteraceae bacterium]